jgi:hypothetical protein
MSMDVTQYKIGDLVKWYEYYEDYIVRDAGLGVVLNAQEFPNFIAPDNTLVTYRVYKFRSRECEWFTHHEMEPLADPEINPPVCES